MKINTKIIVVFVAFITIAFCGGIFTGYTIWHNGNIVKTYQTQFSPDGKKKRKRAFMPVPRIVPQFLEGRPISV